MTEQLGRFDAWIRDNGPSALVMKEWLEPAAGLGEVIFPPTFAPPEDSRDSAPGYIIDRQSGTSVCLLDSVGSQANRLEPMFKTIKYRNLVPQVEIKVKDRSVNLLDAGHRAADALVRSTELASELEKAFRLWAAGDAEPLAKIAPTSLVFGAWDSRGSQAKVPRLVDSTVRAFDVKELHRAAQYFSALQKDEVDELIEDSQRQRTPLSKAGFLDVPAGVTHGGVIVNGEIVRLAVVNLTALRALGAATGERQSALRRYILGLALVVAVAPMDLFFRQGCLLVRRAEKPVEAKTVFRDGRRDDFPELADGIDAFATAAAEAFGVGKNRLVEFDSKRAKELLKKAPKPKEGE